MRSSHGCIRLYPEDIAVFFDTIPIGTKVTVVNQPYLFGWRDGTLYLQAYTVMEDDSRDWNKNRKALLHKLLNPKLEKKISDHDKEIDWQRVGDLAHTPRAVPVPVTGGFGGIDDVIGKSLLVENTLPAGSNWDGKTGLLGGEKTFKELVGGRAEAPPAAPTPGSPPTQASLRRLPHPKMRVPVAGPILPCAGVPAARPPSRHPVDSSGIDYETLPTAAALQWLTPKQRAGRRKAFLYTQSEPIGARTWIPLQDTPQVRATYEARIRTDSDVVAVMSAQNDPTHKRNGDYSFVMPQAIPSYLIALAGGDLKFQATGPRTGVYAEKPVVKAAAKEFADTESMIAASEKLFEPYRWTPYHLLLLPPSLPSGAIENPRL